MKKSPGRRFFRKPLVIHPLLIAAFPILFLYAYNISETSADQIWLPLAFSVGFTIVLWAVLSLILGSLSKGGLAVVIFIVLFFSYGRFYGLLDRWGVSVFSHYHLLPAVLLVFGYSVYFIKLAHRDFRVITRILNIIAISLIVINLFNIIRHEVKAARLSHGAAPVSKEQDAASPSPEELSKLPDIYLIILDEYAHPDTMKEWYDYDSSAFIKSLEDKGFFIASRSRTRTPNTQDNIAQVLNMEYLTTGSQWEGGKWVGTEPEAQLKPDEAFQKIADSSVVDFLINKGYRYIYQASGFERGRYQEGIKKKADHYFDFYVATEFGHVLWNTTMIAPFYRAITGSRYEKIHRGGVLGTLENLKRMPDMQSPKLVITHLMSPHYPFVFGAGGEFIDPVNYKNYKDKRFYLGQYIFISTEIEKVVETLLKESKTPPIIILQSDHGLRPHHPDIIIGSDDWQKILNAMYVPGLDTDMLPHNISPVNTFRLVFNQYFGTGYPLLKND
jgi:hypothetical protein